MLLFVYLFILLLQYSVMNKDYRFDLVGAIHARNVEENNISEFRRLNTAHVVIQCCSP